MLDALWKRWIAPVAFMSVTLSLIAVQAAQTVDLTGYWQDDQGAKYAIRQVGDAVHWVGDGRPSFMNVFDGVVSEGFVRGTWVDVPGGTRSQSGDLALCIDTANRLVKTYSTGYGASVLTRVGTTPTSGPGRCNRPANPSAGGGIGPIGSAGPIGATGATGRTGGTAPQPAPPPTATSPGSAPPTTPTDGITFIAENLRYFGSPTSKDCNTACQNDPKCRGWSWVKPGAFNPGDGPVCYLVARIDSVVSSRCCIAAAKPANAAPPPAPLVVNMTGTWTGTQRCKEGNYAHTMTVQKQDGGSFSGVFEDGSEFKATLDGNKVTIQRPSWNARWDATMTSPTAMQGGTFAPANSPAPQCTFDFSRVR